MTRPETHATMSYNVPALTTPLSLQDWLSLRTAPAVLGEDMSVSVSEGVWACPHQRRCFVRRRAMPREASATRTPRSQTIPSLMRRCTKYILSVADYTIIDSVSNIEHHHFWLPENLNCRLNSE